MSRRGGTTITTKRSHFSARTGKFLPRVEHGLSRRYQFLQGGQKHRHAADDAGALCPSQKPPACHSHLLEQEGRVLSASWSTRAGSSSDPVSGSVKSHREA